MKPRPAAKPASSCRLPAELHLAEASVPAAALAHLEAQPREAQLPEASRHLQASATPAALFHPAAWQRLSSSHLPAVLLRPAVAAHREGSRPRELAHPEFDREAADLLRVGRAQVQRCPKPASYLLAVGDQIFLACCIALSTEWILD